MKKLIPFHFPTKIDDGYAFVPCVISSFIMNWSDSTNTYTITNGSGVCKIQI